MPITSQAFNELSADNIENMQCEIVKRRGSISRSAQLLSDALRRVVACFGIDKNIHPTEMPYALASHGLGVQEVIDNTNPQKNGFNIYQLLKLDQQGLPVWEKVGFVSDVFLAQDGKAWVKIDYYNCPGKSHTQELIGGIDYLDEILDGQD